MENLSTITPESPPGGAAGADGVSVVRWFLAYGLLLAASAGAAWILLAREPWGWSAWADDFVGTFRQTGPAIKLLTFGVYLSLCCTFLPLPTGWLVAGVATEAVAVGGDVWATTVLVALVGGAASTVANLNDYHLFTWMLRHHRIATIRQTRIYRAAARWFAGSPFFILFVFNVIPIPVDVVRMVAATSRYPRAGFAAANFLGRVVRYAVIAFATYSLGAHGWIAAAVLFGVALLLAGGRVARSIWRKRSQRREPAAG